MIQITENPIDISMVLKSVETEKAGAVVHFLGTVRKEKGIRGLFYECYPEMASLVLKEIVELAVKKWGVEKISLVHRIGWVELGEPSVVIAVSSAHRKEAFEACRFVIDQIKEIAPIWKREFSETERKFQYAQN